MSYIITTTNGNVLLTLPDGTTDSSTGVTLIGKNYTNYGLAQNDNFVSLVENFAGTVSPDLIYTSVLKGMVWYDSTNDLIKVFDGTTFNPVSGRIKSATEPTAKNIGDQWWDTTNNQLKTWTGSSWILIGPSYSITQGLTGQTTTSIQDLLGNTHTVMDTFVSNSLVAITSLASFVPQVGIQGFPAVYAGLTISNDYTLAANTATFASNVTIAGTATIGTVNANFVNTTSNVTTANLSVSNNLTSNAIYEGASRVITRVEHTAGPGISVTGQIPTGPNASVVINNTGVLSVAGGTGIQVDQSTGNVVVTNTGVTSAIAGIGVSLSNSTGTVHFSIGQNVATDSTPTFNGVNIWNRLLPTSNVAIDLGSTLYTFRTAYANTYVGNTYTGATYVGNAFVGNVYTGTTFNGTNYNGVNYTGNTFTGNTFTGTAVAAYYADLAENYLADTYYPAGTVVVFGGVKEITVTNIEADVSVAGVISTNPAYLMNKDLDNGLPVALRGRVPVLVTGTVKKGDLLVTSSIPGYAMSVGTQASYGIAIFAKAIEDKTTSELGTVEAVII